MATAQLVDELVADLHPVRPLRLREGLMLTSITMAMTAVAALWQFGLRDDMAGGNIDPLSLLASGLFLLLGIAASVTVISMSRPQVGNDHGGWKWAAAMVALLPTTAIGLAVLNGPHALNHAMPDAGMRCLTQGGLLSLMTAAALTLWLRRGAPTSPNAAGLLVGIAAGSIGIFAYSLHCGIGNIYHIGLWHSLSVVAAAAVGRTLVPWLLRW
ncbi:MAG: DUF1109 domain-containing protein [Sphingopyxis sp.]